jgi:hypothetical protein
MTDSWLCLKELEINLQGNYDSVICVWHTISTPSNISLPQNGWMNGIACVTDMNVYKKDNITVKHKETFCDH